MTFQHTAYCVLHWLLTQNQWTSPQHHPSNQEHPGSTGAAAVFFAGGVADASQDIRPSQPTPQHQHWSPVDTNTIHTPARRPLAPLPLPYGHDSPTQVSTPGCSLHQTQDWAWTNIPPQQWTNDTTALPQPMLPTQPAFSPQPHWFIPPTLPHPQQHLPTSWQQQQFPPLPWQRHAPPPNSLTIPLPVTNRQSNFAPLL